MNLYTNIFLPLSLIFASTFSFAKECSKSVSCEFYVNEQRDLMHRSDGSVSQNGKRINGPSMRGVYVMLRGSQYYLVKESETNDKSFMVVSILKSGGRVLFDRVLYFSIAIQASSQRGYNVWSGDELALKTPQGLSKFSWNLASQWQNNFEPREASSQKIIIQDGFRSVESFVHDVNGKVNGRRTYIYPTQLDVTPESLVCFESCPTNQTNFPVNRAETLEKIQLSHSL